MFKYKTSYATTYSKTLLFRLIDCRGMGMGKKHGYSDIMFLIKSMNTVMYLLFK